MAVRAKKWESRTVAMIFVKNNPETKYGFLVVIRMIGGEYMYGTIWILQQSQCYSFLWNARGI